MLKRLCDLSWDPEGFSSSGEDDSDDAGGNQSAGAPRKRLRRGEGEAAASGSEGAAIPAAARGKWRRGSATAVEGAESQFGESEAYSTASCSAASCFGSDDEGGDFPGTSAESRERREELRLVREARAELLERLKAAEVADSPRAGASGGQAAGGDGSKIGEGRKTKKGQKAVGRNDGESGNTADALSAVGAAAAPNDPLRALKFTVFALAPIFRGRLECEACGVTTLNLGDALQHLRAAKHAKRLRKWDAAQMQLEEERRKFNRKHHLDSSDGEF